MELEDLLAQQGCEVLETVCTVPDALDTIAAESPDAVVLDLNLDGNPTVPIAEKLIERGTPFVVVSGFVESTIADAALKQAPFVQKPWNRRELLRKLGALL